LYQLVQALEKRPLPDETQPEPPESDTSPVNVEHASDVFEVPNKSETGELRERRRKRAAVHIANEMEDAYSQADLRDLCFAFDIDYESVEGETKRDKIRAFVRHFYHRNTLRVLVEFLEGDRPERIWRVK
jgi:hypothetical protein